MGRAVNALQPLVLFPSCSHSLPADQTPLAAGLVDLILQLLKPLHNLKCWHTGIQH